MNLTDDEQTEVNLAQAWHCQRICFLILQASSWHEELQLIVRRQCDQKREKTITVRVMNIQTGELARTGMATVPEGGNWLSAMQEVLEEMQRNNMSIEANGS